MGPTAPLWITWEHQRRSLVLSKEFGANLVEILPQGRGRGLRRYLIQTWATVVELARGNPDLLFVQNPSMVLAMIGTLYRAIHRRTVLVVDRHSNFFPVSTIRLVNAIHDVMSRATIRGADLTVVTNDYLREVVESAGGNGFVLEDRIPPLRAKQLLALPGKHRVLYVCSFASDEPYLQVFEAARLLDPQIHVLVSGDYGTVRDKHVFDRLPQNVSLLGYLEDQAYVDHLFSVDAVMALTDWEYTLLCGAYEAVAAGKPLILSNKRHLTSYFSRGVVRVENTPVGIAGGIATALREREALTVGVAALKEELEHRWLGRFRLLKARIETQVLGRKEKRA